MIKTVQLVSVALLWKVQRVNGLAYRKWYEGTRTYGWKSLYNEVLRGIEIYAHRRPARRNENEGGNRWFLDLIVVEQFRNRFDFFLR